MLVVLFVDPELVRLGVDEGVHRIDDVVALTLKPPAAGLTHWSTRDLARHAGVSHGTVHRIWRAHALKPHQVSTFKFTTDPQAEAKIYDVVGLYLDPPTNAVVLSLDEKTQRWCPDSCGKREVAHSSGW